MSEAQARQVGGEHYVSAKVQPWDVWASDPDMDPFTATVIKYMMRWRKKNGLLDLQKAAHTLERLIELERDRAEDRPEP